MNPIRVYFAGLREDDDSPVDLAKAMRIGGRGPAAWPDGPHRAKYDQLNSDASNYFAAAPLDEADVVVYAYRAQDHQGELTDVAVQAKNRGIPCLFFTWGDAYVPIRVPYGQVYGHSLIAEKCLESDRAMPAFCADPLGGGTVQPRQWQRSATVGFCGYVGDPMRRTMYRLMGRAEKVAGLELRSSILKRLRKSPRVLTQFICRSAYFAGAIGRFHRNPAAQALAWNEYRENLFSCDYTLCVRGAGNFSYRFYEVLAGGRIPLFVNTRCVLPFPDQIEWQRHCVWVEEDQLDRIGDKLADFHAALSPQQFVELQQANRRLWEEKLSPLGFYRTLLTGVSEESRLAKARA
ncbi:MAG TPA: hypothetical protein VMD30_02530 [Tepidisphaeraceae bacterium]|nr:hypothetical protein [Tepidisphaeraceae bacterium]